jgi:hypothetical protein
MADESPAGGGPSWTGRLAHQARARRRPLGLLACGLALAVAIVYLVVVPAEAAAVTGPARWVLQYAHSLCWLLLAAASLGWALRASRRLVSVVAWSALGCYGLFLITLLVTRPAAG